MKNLLSLLTGWIRQTYANIFWLSNIFSVHFMSLSAFAFPYLLILFVIFPTFHIADSWFTSEWIRKHLLWGLVCNHLITFLNDPIHPKNVVICLLVLECYYVIRLVGIKQIPSVLLSYNRLKRFFFSPGRVGKFDSCLDGVRNLNQNCQVFSAK